MADSYVKCQYRFFFMVEDEGGEQLDIVVTDPEVRRFNHCPLRIEKLTGFIKVPSSSRVAASSFL
jgi:hypothetical protein